MSCRNPLARLKSALTSGGPARRAPNRLKIKLLARPCEDRNGLRPKLSASRSGLSENSYHHLPRYFRDSMFLKTQRTPRADSCNCNIYKGLLLGDVLRLRYVRPYLM